MSGSSRSGGGGGSYGGDSPDCSRLKFDAQLVSPQPAVVTTLAVGEVLGIRLQEMGGQSIVQVVRGEAPAGGLVGPLANRLRECIEQGHDFSADVLSVHGGQVRVHVASTR